MSMDEKPRSRQPAEPAPATSAPPEADRGGDVMPVELSIVLPCLNEQETLGSCLRKARAALTSHGINGEIIVADNGSTDGSVEIAREYGARIVHVQEKGYGSALMGGIEAARGDYVLVGDADDSYDFGECPRFLERLRAGDDVVLGNRFTGGIRRGAMPWHHRLIGNPLLTRILNMIFGTVVGDVHCGMRALTRQAYRRMNLRTTGMEFASEMVVKACFAGMKIGEVPITYWPDGRSRPSHLRSFRDGWRHLRFLLLYSPRWLFAVPGIGFLSLGLVINAVLLFGRVRVGQVEFGPHMMVLGALIALLGFQVLCVGAFAKVFALTELLQPPDANFEALFKRFTLERGIAAGAVVAAVGLAFLTGLLVTWYQRRFGPLDVDRTLRPAIAGMTLVVLGIQIIFSSFFMSVLGLKRKELDSRRPLN